MSKIKGFVRQYSRILHFVKGLWGLLFLSLILNIIFSLFETMSIAIIQPVIQILFDTDGVRNVQAVTNPSNPFEGIKNAFYAFIHSMIFVDSSMEATLIRLSVLILIIFFLKNIFKYAATIAGTNATVNIIKNMRDIIFTKLTSLSVDFFSKSRQGHLISVITNDVNSVNGNTISTITTIIKDFTQIAIFLMFLIAVSPYLTLVAFSTSIVSLLFIKISIKYLRKYAGSMQESMSNYTTALQETLFGMRIVKAYNAEVSINNKFKSHTSEFVKFALKHRTITAIIPMINELFAIGALCFVLFLGGKEVIDNQMRGEDLMLFLFALFSIMSPISSFINQFTSFQTGLVAADRIFTVLDAKPSVVDGEEHHKGLKSEIEVKNLHFAYEPEKEVLKNCNLIIPKGKKIALVGGSGSGKSTMLDLIIRFYDPTSGEILLDGENIKNYNAKEYRSLFGVVSQETLLFNDTIANNIKYGFEATDEEVIQATITANAYSFISKMPDGINSIIGDRGVLISGGERQRIAIARALLRKPKVLVFDEATSALDVESEKIVQDAINVSLINRTAIIIAHRLSTIKDCDCIYVLDKGSIVESGSHSELLALGGIYKKMCDIQYDISSKNENVN